jgi:lipopolysaccharide/colanic/teichoic acid biosynthesis glycosyltransferase
MTSAQYTTPLLSVDQLSTFNRRKRIIDVLFVLATLPIVLPLAVILASLTLLQQGRPVIYRQERLGFQEKVFYIRKFRTMSDTRDEQGELLSDALRITPTGAFMRKTSLDELPQLWNVLMGDMALVGPRPLYPRYLPFYSPNERRRHLVRPGITGLAQVSGRNEVRWDQRFELDVAYVDRRSLRLDALIPEDTEASSETKWCSRHRWNNRSSFGYRPSLSLRW